MRWLLALAVILLAGNSSGVGKPDVVFDGDSITVLATPAIHQLLDSRYHVEVLATDGIRIDQGLPALIAALSFHPYAVVENLGTNDALQGGAPNDRGSSWAELIRITRTTPCVVLTTINLRLTLFATDRSQRRSMLTSWLSLREIRRSTKSLIGTDS